MSTVKPIRRQLIPLALGSILLLVYAVSTRAAGLNDTGVTTCADAAGATISCTALTAVQGQDARYGRDAAAGTSALTKVGGGANGFDFTKISNAGALLPANAVLGTNPGDWGCTYDNTTGLMWEVKTASGLRASGQTYTWFSSNSAMNGGATGTANGGSCSTSATTGRCDTEKFVQDVNATNMCGHSDWRMPTFRELRGLVRQGVSPSIDGAYFPNTVGQTGVTGAFWSSSPIASGPSTVWVVHFGDGFSGLSPRGVSGFVRLVRVGQ